jgi:hypothetical protein
METAAKREQTTGRMLANRKVVEMQCGICNKGFQLGETVQECPHCQGFHHAVCWDSGQTCPQVLENEKLVGDGMILTTVAAEEIATAGQPSKPATQLAEDERLCPSCRKVIKKEALKCRFCSYTLDTALAAKSALIVEPPTLSWIIVLGLNFATSQIFGFIWAWRQAWWAKKAVSSNRALISLVVCVLCFFIAGGVEMEKELKPLSGLLFLGGAVYWLVAIFSIRNAMQVYYNSVEPMGLNLSGGMTFFFGCIYFQYHFTRLARERQARMAAQKEML